ncbi:probable polyamine transporter At3g13620 [Rhododendron vialii]|uniref:probable polyamine transporter At3g13620 n=1 Tax=Rhododendron vialii TaxID=182163 RepID=UPI00265DE8B5|nr:probable polyamine transporter At3g13620 [Rhododendron vialii]
MFSNGHQTSPPQPPPTTSTTPVTTQNPPQLLPITTTTTTTTTHDPKKLTLIPLIFLIYFEVAGGPYGEEPAVQAAGPLLAILGFLIFPFIWSIPEALITAELSTAFPGDGGFVIWADAAFGPFFGSLMGTWKFLSGVINIAAFPVLCVDYLQNIFSVFSGGYPRYLAVTLSTLLLSFVNYLGLSIVGYFAVFLGIISLLPFIVMSLIAIPQIKPHRWLSLGQKGVKHDWNIFFNTLFWNLNFWDNVSTLAGEVKNPQKIFPKALFIAVIFTCLAYIIPLMAVTGAVLVDQSEWEAGFMAQAAEIISGKWLKLWIEIGAVLSGIGLFEAQLSSSAYQVLGMAELGFLPKIFGVRSKWFGTPWVGIVLSTVITLSVSFMNFTDIISSANFLYSLGMLLEFASFVWLRRKYPAMKRPFRVPMGIPGLVVMCLVPSAFLVFIMAIATKVVYLVSGLMTVAGVGWYFFIKYCKAKKWFKFSENGDKFITVGNGEGLAAPAFYLYLCSLCNFSNS